LGLDWLLLRRVNVRDLALLVSKIADGAQLVGVLAVLAERLWEVGRAHACRLLSHCVLLLEHVFLLANLSEPGVLQRL